jgi:hypothetical protein
MESNLNEFRESMTMSWNAATEEQRFELFTRLVDHVIRILEFGQSQGVFTDVKINIEKPRIQ